MDLTGRVAIVTGAAQGIGRAIAERFVEAGAAGVTMADVQCDQVEQAAVEIAQALGGQLLPLEADVSDEASVAAMVRRTVELFGRVDILVNNAGICPVVAWDDVTLDSWNRLLAVNVTGQFLCTRAVLPHMRARGYGRIVFVSSEAAFFGSMVAHVAYGVSKAGIVALMKSVAKGFAADGVLANAIAPGPIDTPLAHTLGKKFWAAAEERTLLKRHATAREVADVALFLASDASSYVTGQVLRVNGGGDLA